jgi:hypothetical protein
MGLGMGIVSVDWAVSDTGSSVTTSAEASPCSGNYGVFALLPGEYTSIASDSTTTPCQFSSFATAFLQRKYKATDTHFDPG